MESRGRVALNQRDSEFGNANSGRSGSPEGLRFGEYLDRIAGELHERVQHQQDVLRKFLCEGAGMEKIPYCPLVDCSRIEKLRSAIRETIGVLEETRNAFKSKRLEVMRKKLIEILAES